jgi:predicted nucleic acid-binding protein
MRIFLDTSVLVASIVRQHREHERSFALLDRVQSGRDQGVISAHSLAETYATLTKLPPPFRHSPEQALLSIEENILKHFHTADLLGKTMPQSSEKQPQPGFRAAPFTMRCC